MTKISENNTQLLNELKQLRAENSALKKIQKLFNDGPLVIFKWCNSPNWPVEYVSSNVNDIFGYTVADFYSGKAIYVDIIATSDLARVTEEVVNASNEGVHSFDHKPYQIIHKDGTIRWIYDHTIIIRDEHNKVSHFYGYVFDITRYKMTEAALNISEIQSKSILDNTEAVIYIKDLNGYFLQVNQHFENFFNIQSSDIIGKTDYDFFAPKQADILRTNDLKVLELNQKIEFEEQVTKNNELQTYISQKFPLYDEHNKVYGICGISINITDEKRREQKLSASTEECKKTEFLLQKTCDNLQLTLKKHDNNLFYLSRQIQIAVEQRIKVENTLKQEQDFVDGLIDTAQEIILILDLKGKILRINTFFEKLSGYNSNEARGKSGVKTFLNREGYSTAKALFHRILAGEQVDNMVFPLIKKNGNHCQISWNCKGISDTDGNIKNLLVIGYDVTERIKTNKKLHESKARYKLLFESSPVALWEKDFTQLYAYFDQLRKKGVNDFRTFFDQNTNELKKCAQKIKVINVNKAAIKLHGEKNKEDLLGSLNSVFTESSLNVFKEQNIAFANGQTEFKSEAKVKTLSGQFRNILLKIKIEKKSSGKVKALVATPNITEQKQAEKTLAQQQKILIAVAEISNNLLNTDNWKEEVEHALALIGKSANISRAYIFEAFNGSEDRLLFRQEYEWCTHGVTKQITNSELQSLDFNRIGFSGVYQQLLNNNIVICRQSDFSEIQHDHLDPQDILSMLIVPLFIDDAFWGFIGFDDCFNERIWNKVEIAALKLCAGVISGALQREQSCLALRESEQRFRSLVESTSDMIWEIDLNGVYTYVSPSIEGILGYNAADIIGKTPFDLMPDAEAKRLKSVFSDISNKLISFTGLENINLHRDGYSVELETNGVPIFDHMGQAIGYRGIDRDISNRKEAENTREIQAEKQRDLLIKEVHHRIKNHLQGLIGLLKQHGKDKHQYDEIISKMITQIESIAIVYGLQSFRSESQIYLLEMVQAIVQSLTGLTQISLSLTQSGQLSSFEIDKNKAVALALVINELIMNAIKYFSSDNKQRKITIHHDYGSNYIALSVSNPGSLPKEFDFISGKGLGTGLELAKAMLPTQGAEFLVEEKNGIVIATLLINSPLLVIL